MSLDMTGVRIDQDYLWTGGCERCQDGAHWECHGCSCPCSWPEDYDSPEEHRAAIEAIRPTITTEQREEQWRMRELAATTALVKAESERGVL